MDGIETFHTLFSHVIADCGVDAVEVKKAADEFAREQGRRPWEHRFGKVDYDSLPKRCGYLLRYAGCHCEMKKESTLKVLSDLPGTATELLTRDKLHIVSVGGGPGNDLIGFCRAIIGDNRRTCRNLELTVVDINKGWRDIYDKLMNRVFTGNYNMGEKLFQGIEVTHNFMQANMTTDGPKAIETADVILMTKVLSNVPRGEKKRILRNIFLRMKLEAILIYTDIYADLVEQVAESKGLTVLLTDTEMLYGNFRYLFADDWSIDASSYEICVVQAQQYKYYLQ